MCEREDATLGRVGFGLRAIVAALILGAFPVVAGALSSSAASAQIAIGSVTPFGDANLYGTAPAKLHAPVVGMAATGDGHGYWLVAGDGGVFAFGDAGFYGSEAATTLAVPVVGMAATPDGHGYWLVTDVGGIYTFGDANVDGTAPVTLNAPVVGMVATPDGLGYWLVAADGGVFAFGDAGFFGSMGGRPLNQPVVGMAADGHGYWLVAADGGMFSFGDAGFFGSEGATPPSYPVVGMASTPGGHGYWLATTAKALPRPTPVPSVLSECNIAGGGPAVKPASIVLACGDGNASLTHLVWSSWTASTAMATGDYTHNLCTPNCAQGVFVSVPATVELSYSIETGVGREFSTVRYSYADRTAPGGRTTYTAVIETSAG